MLNTGDRMPAFRVQDQDGNEVTDKDFEGKKIVLYFYPKDSTPGCTRQACAFFIASSCNLHWDILASL